MKDNQSPRTKLTFNVRLSKIFIGRRLCKFLLDVYSQLVEQATNMMEMINRRWADQIMITYYGQVSSNNKP